MRKVRFVFGKEMTDEQMWQAFKKFAKECGFLTRDTHNMPKKKAKNETPRRRKNDDRD